MNKVDLYNLFSTVVEMGETELHRVSISYSPIATHIFIHLKDKNGSSQTVCSNRSIFKGEELTKKDVEWLTNWKAVFETERVAYETN